jgi:IS30 family transposase
VSHHHLTRDQRVELGVLLRLGYKKSQIASQLHVHRCTIGREIQRNGHTNQSGYNARLAQTKAKARRLLNRPGRRP